MKFETEVNPLPVLTWAWLRMNKAHLAEDLGCKKSGSVFEAKGLEKGARLSQKGALSESGGAKKNSMPGALGKNFDELIFNNASAAVLEIPAGVKIEEPITLRLKLNDGEAAFNSLEINAGPGSEATVIIEWTSEKNAHGLNASQTKITAQENARIKVSTVQLLGTGFVHLNDIATSGGENSTAQVAQLELGAKKSFFGAYSTLEAPLSRFVHNAAYFADGEREFDMNFVALQKGKKSQCLMNVYGTLKDSAKKTYRGTIDFKKGCEGAVGNELEDTLLLSPSVANKSIPLILCDEENVQGEHGATIGRLDESVLFYMNSRGISLEEAQKMAAKSKIARVASEIGDMSEAQKALDFFDQTFFGGEAL